ncbi:MAG: zinc ribbon domain-containing protein [Spirochaetia bacterium]|nr:zinc ribbon domain-containing protein [Spirochaetia bacterium]
MVYEYRCRDCETVFEVQATMEEKAKGLNPVCPNCASKNTAQVFSSIGIFRRTAAGSAGGAFSCGPNPGSGCCG